MKEVLISVLFVIILVFMTTGSFNREFVAEHAEAEWVAQGFEVVAYEGYQWGTGFRYTRYGGGKVWYRLKKIPDNGITYSGYIQRWGDELHVYGPNATEALKP